MRVVFMGTPEIAVPSFMNIIHSRHELVAVFTQPDQKSGRGMTLRFSPVKQAAIQEGIPCYQPQSLQSDEVLEQLKALEPDVIAVAAYAQKIPNSILELPPFGCINMHPSLLPKYRGSGPLRGPILNGDAESGVSIMKLVEQWDAGDILLQEAFALDPKETSASLEEKCMHLGADLMVKTLDGLEEGSIVPTPQDASQATYLKQISKEAGLIDFSRSAVEIERQIRACIPWPSAYTQLEGKTFKIWDADVIQDASLEEACADAEYGSVVKADKKGILIKCNHGFLDPKEVQLEGKKRMNMEEFLRGKKITQGLRFGTV